MYRAPAIIAAMTVAAFFCPPALGQFDHIGSIQLPNPSHGFEMLEAVFQPQHPNVDDGIFKVRAMFAAHSVPEPRGVTFYVEVGDVHNIGELNAKVGPEVIKKADAMIKGWQDDKDAFEKSGRNAFGDICASAPGDPGCHFVQEKRPPQRPEDEKEAGLPKNGYIIQYIALRPRFRGIMDGHYSAEVSVTALSMPQFWDRKLYFKLADVQSIDEVRRLLPNLIDKEADDTIAELSKDRGAFDKAQRKH